MTFNFKIAFVFLTLLPAAVSSGQEVVSTVAYDGSSNRPQSGDPEATATITGSEDRSASMKAEILVDTVDGNLEIQGYQVYSGSHLADITYSARVIDADKHSLAWCWCYSVDGGQEKVACKGTGAVSPITIDYTGTRAAAYEWRLHLNDGITSIEERQATEVLSGTWSPTYAHNIVLDFDGSYEREALTAWNVDIPRFDQDGDKTTFSPAELDAMFQIHSALTEKFSPFNLGIAAADPFDPTGFSNRDEESAAREVFYWENDIVHVAIGGASFVPQFGPNGIAGNNAFTNNFPNNAFVFPKGPKLLGVTEWIWEVAAHEAGHVFGLTHQSKGEVGYFEGDNEKAPIMGRVQDKRGLWWPREDDSGFGNGDMNEIAKPNNGFGYRPDEAGESPSEAAALSAVLGTSFASYGVISPTKDVDYYEFTTTQFGKVSFRTSVAPYGAMLDTKLQLKDANDQLVVESSNVTQLEESITNFDVQPGTYYLVVQGQELYGDVGQYWIDGSVPHGTTTTAGESVPNKFAAPIFSDGTRKSTRQARKDTVDITNQPWRTLPPGQPQPGEQGTADAGAQKAGVFSRAVVTSRRCVVRRRIPRRRFINFRNRGLAHGLSGRG